MFAEEAYRVFSSRDLKIPILKSLNHGWLSACSAENLLFLSTFIRSYRISRNRYDLFFKLVSKSDGRIRFLLRKRISSNDFPLKSIFLLSK